MTVNMLVVRKAASRIKCKYDSNDSKHTNSKDCKQWKPFIFDRNKLINWNRQDGVELCQTLLKPALEKPARYSSHRTSLSVNLGFQLIGSGLKSMLSPLE